jgi:hypothetical protein
VNSRLTRSHVDQIHARIVNAIGPYSSLRHARENGVYVHRVRDDVALRLMPFAKRLANSLVKLPTSSRMSLDEIESAALLGLIEGVDSFEPRRGVRISTHLFIRIRKSVRRECENNHWVTYRAPRTAAERYLSGRMTESEMAAYAECHLKSFAIPGEHESWDPCWRIGESRDG